MCNFQVALGVDAHVTLETYVIKHHIIIVQCHLYNCGGNSEHDSEGFTNSIEMFSWRVDAMCGSDILTVALGTIHGP